MHSYKNIFRKCRITKRNVCSGLRAPQLRIRPRPCPISGVRAKYIYIITKIFLENA